MAIGMIEVMISFFALIQILIVPKIGMIEKALVEEHSFLEED